MNVSLTVEQEKYVHEKVATGKYASASEVIREGLRLLQEQEEMRLQRMRQVDAEIQRGLDSARSGRVVSGTDHLRALKQKAVGRTKTGRR